MEGAVSKVGKRLTDLSDIPERLLGELQMTKQGKLDVEIIDVIKTTYEGAANIDEILVGIFRKYQRELKRTFLANKLNRMVKANDIYAVTGKKGVYSTDKLNTPT